MMLQPSNGASPTNRASQGKQLQRATVKNHFKSYVKFLTSQESYPGGIEYDSLEDLCKYQKDLFTEDFLAKFIDYIYKNSGVLSSLTMDSYIAQLKPILLENGFDRDHSLFRTDFFQKLSEKIRNQYQKDGYFRDESFVLQESDLEEFCRPMLEDTQEVVGEEKEQQQQIDKQIEEAINRCSQRHPLDADLPDHWFRYFTPDQEEVSCSSFPSILLFSFYISSSISLVN